jgi:hypothetical protein
MYVCVYVCVVYVCVSLQAGECMLVSLYRLVSVCVCLSLYVCVSLQVRDTSLPEGEWRDTLCYCRQGYDIRCFFLFFPLFFFLDGVTPSDAAARATTCGVLFSLFRRIHKDTDRHTHTYTHRQTHTRTHIRTRTPTRPHAHTHIHTCIHTQ